MTNAHKIIKEQEDDTLLVKAELRKILKPGDRIYTILRHVSSSGMSRRISVIAIGENAKPYSLDWYIEKLGIYKRDNKKDGLRVNGCGMDMGSAVTYSLGRSLFPKGFKLAKDQYGRNGDKSGYDNDGGYAFKHEWL